MSAVDTSSSDFRCHLVDWGEGTASSPFSLNQHHAGLPFLMKEGPAFAPEIGSPAFFGEGAEREGRSSSPSPSSGSSSSAVLCLGNPSSGNNHSPPNQTKPATAGPQAAPKVHFGSPPVPAHKTHMTPTDARHIQRLSPPHARLSEVDGVLGIQSCPVAKETPAQEESVSPAELRHTCQTEQLSWKGSWGLSPGPSYHGRGKERLREGQ